MKITVCRNCTDRFIGCHDKCDKYKQQRNNRDLLLTERHEKIKMHFDIKKNRQRAVTYSTNERPNPTAKK